MMAKKLGLNKFDPEMDDTLIAELLDILPLVETDMTIFYRKLALVDIGVGHLDEVSHEDLMAPLMDAYYVPEQLTDGYKRRAGGWIRNYIRRVRQGGTPDETRRSRMNAVNPKYVLRNFLAQLAIDQSEQGDHSLVNDLLDLLRRPYDEQPGQEEYAQKRPDWARQRPGCSMLSCSS
jgi:uncharacterized protein YdiU (UPF0061 family)